MWRGLIEEYREFLPVTASTPVISINEGNTPLIQLKHIPKTYQIPGKWYVKYEGLNPTGSFKDRGMTLAVSKAIEEGSSAIICASTGNTSASAAAYAARAGIECCVLIPEGKVALGKISQAMMHGATVLQLKGNFDEALEHVRAIAKKYPICLVNSINPYRIEGQKTAAFEIVSSLGVAPDFHFIPVGNAGNITAHWKGYSELFASKKILKRPRMMGVQAEGSAPFITGSPVINPNTIATAIQIGNPANWSKAKMAQSESNGDFFAVSDDEISHAQQALASMEGIFCEPASASSIAGVIKNISKLSLHTDSIIVSTLTGHGLKDPDRAIAISKKPVLVDNNEDGLIDHIKRCL